MKLLYRILRQDPENRDGAVTVTSTLNIAVNILLALVKIAAGVAVSSIAIVSEGVNNATDAGSSILALAGVRLSLKLPTEKHPFGYGRIEYLASMVIALMILVPGYELLKESVSQIAKPSALEISYVTLGILAVTAVVKFFLGCYTISEGRRVKSTTLEALGLEGRNDSFVSLITIVSSLVFLLSGFSIDSYAGIVISLLILRAGFQVLSGTVRDLLGRPGDRELAEKLYAEIRSVEGIVNVADMMLHNYGPERYSGSVNVEIDHARTVGDVYKVLHNLQLRIMHQHHVTMVFGIYAVDSDHEDSGKMRNLIADFVTAHEHIKSFHALYIDHAEKKIYCDFVVDYELQDRAGLHQEFLEYMNGFYPDKSLELVIETEYV